MIDEARTLEIFGYNVKDLAPHSSKRIIVICERCGNVRVTSMQTYNAQKYPDLCKSCILTGHEVSPEARAKLRNARLGTHISEETKTKMSISQTGENNHFYGKKHTLESRAKTSGKNHYNWKGGIAPVMERIRWSRSYKNWRAAVFERDDYTCQMCSVRGGYLQAHHIEPVRDNKNTLLIFDTNNGITLCKDCHNKTKHKEYDFIEQFKNIVENINKKD